MIYKEGLAQIILDYQKNELPPLISRSLQVDLEIPLRRATVIIGPRRSGKTFYLYSLVKTLLEQKVAKERTLYINFESQKLAGASSAEIAALIDVFYELYPQNKRKKIWLFLDEIQNVKDWEVVVREMLDNGKAYVFISGSSSKLLSKEIATSLRGRTLDYLMLPFSFQECLRLKNIVYKKYLTSEEKAGLLHEFGNYFSWGGYPETLIYPQERKRILSEIVEVTIHRDLIERYKIRNTKVIKIMFNYLISAKEFSVHKFYGFLKSMNIRVSKNSLYNYLEYFHDAFIFFPLRKFSYSLKNTEQSIPKIYSVDNGLLEVIIGEDRGKKFENLVFLSLLQKRLEPNKDIFYHVHNDGEVDFLIKKGKRVTRLIQACSDLSNYDTKEREIKALVRASQEFQCRDLFVITSDYEGREKIKNRDIKFIPLWKWLLE